MPRGRLSKKQTDFTELVAGGMDELEAVVKAGYSEKYKYQALSKLTANSRIEDRIKLLESGGNEIPTKIATRADREAFWTSVMDDPKNSLPSRLEASKLLGKAQGDFIDRKQIETKVKHEPIVVIPNMTPDEWEKYWEHENETT